MIYYNLWLCGYKEDFDTKIQQLKREYKPAQANQRYHGLKPTEEDVKSINDLKKYNAIVAKKNEIITEITLKYTLNLNDIKKSDEF